ncbi:MAG: lipopolysaccharide heptosyltransferase family protein, partial [Verrucomicrobia bacterium]|nr:lipopolysaccharide heptosyltransferase family protein [Verrucomicrobiota bacterium]
MARHPLLDSFHVRTKWPTAWSEWRGSLQWFMEVVRRCEGDLLIDFEPSGIRTSLLAAWARWRTGLDTVGVAEVPGRGWFYRRAAP